MKIPYLYGSLDEIARARAGKECSHEKPYFDNLAHFYVEQMRDEAIQEVIDSYNRPIIDDAIESALKEKSTKSGKGLFGLNEPIPTYLGPVDTVEYAEGKVAYYCSSGRDPWRSVYLNLKEKIEVLRQL